VGDARKDVGDARKAVGDARKAGAAVHPAKRSRHWQARSNPEVACAGFWIASFCVLAMTGAFRSLHIPAGVDTRIFLPIYSFKTH
jgi:hypothetical protein